MPTQKEAVVLAAATAAAGAALLYKYWHLLPTPGTHSITTPSLLLLNDLEVKQALPVLLAVGIQKQAFQDQFDNSAVVPERIVLSLPQYQGATLFKPAFIPHPPRIALGLKVVSTRPTNAQQHLPTVPATILMMDPSTGLPSALLNGTYLTALRTAAGSGVATDLFASPDAAALTLFGAGMQAKAHLDVVLAVRPKVHTLIIVNRTESRATLLQDYAQSTYPQLTTVRVLHKATQDSVSTADIICTTTNSSVPVFNGNWLSSGTHINAIGSYTPTMQELDIATVQRCCIFIDTPHALICGDLSMAGVTKGMEIGEACFLGAEKARNLALQQQDRAAEGVSGGCTLFKSVGTSVQDVATGAEVVKRAQMLGIGRLVRL
jgi:ornithine cyclodeaminase/alanine dehydrogenase-like protein (mu-crystallin family)